MLPTIRHEIKNGKVLLLFLILFLTLLILPGCRSLQEPHPGEPAPDKTLDAAAIREKEIMKPVPEISITKWAGNAEAACSLTFDDGTLDHYKTAYPILQEYGFKATFFLMVKERENGSWNDYGHERNLMSWQQAAELNRTGHEIGSHSLTHRDIRAVNGREDEEDILRKELYNSKNLIEKKTGADIRTFAWPFWRYSSNSREEVLSFYSAARTGSIYPSHITDLSKKEQASPTLPGAIPSYAILPGQEIEEWQALAADVRRKGGWLTLCLHGIKKKDAPEQNLGWEPITDEVFRSLLDYLKENNIWTAPFGDVYQYIQLRDRGKIEITEFTPTRLTVDLSLPMEYTAPPVPVTLEIKLPSAWNGNIYSADGNVIILQRDETRILADLIPHPPSDKGRKLIGF